MRTFTPVLSLSRALVCALLCCTACGGSEPEPDNSSTAPAPDMRAPVSELDMPADLEPDMKVEPDVDMKTPVIEEDMKVGGDDACPAPLSVDETQQAFAEPFQRVPFLISGGTGEYRFEFVTNNSEGIINELTGDYLAGRVEGVTDTIRVIDLGCDGELEAEIEVVAPMNVAPEEIELAPGQGFTYAVSGGSGSFEYAIETMETGGNINADGRYVAGSNPGRDVVEITDAKTRKVARAFVFVSAGASFRSESEVVFVPLGQTHQLRVVGGSGMLAAGANTESFSISEDGLITPKTVGTQQITIKDAFTEQPDEITVHVVEPQLFPQVHAGEFFSNNTVIARRDLNNDGIPDAVLSLPESDLGGWRSGAVFIYEGSASGFLPMPVQVIAGEKSDDFFGFDVDVEDLDADGNLDLLVGARLADSGSSNSGAVYVYYGLENGFFKDEADLVLSGDRSGSEFGWDVETCDFNGDGRQDIAVGTPLNEDATAQPVRSNQGGVQIFLNYPGGFLTKADVKIYGKTLSDSGDWDNQVNLNLGRFLATGDIDGDGLCDLAAGADLYDMPDGSQNDVGLVLVYKGLGPDTFGPGGVATLPALALRQDIPGRRNSRFGWQLDIGDVNGDDQGELLVGSFNYQHTRTNGDGSTTNISAAGAAFLFEGQALGDEPATAYTSSASASWAIYGDNGSDQWGWDVVLADANGDDLADIFVTNRSDELPGGPGSTGTVLGYYGVAGGLDQLSTTPDISVRGVNGSDLLGQGVDITADRDGDSIAEVVSFAPRSDTIGTDVGELFYFPSTGFGDVNTAVGLIFDDEPSGSWSGHSSALVPDISGDGQPDLLVGAPLYDPEDQRVGNGGAVFIYKSSPDGFGAEPDKILTGFRTYSNIDNFGWRVSTAGDFNGDGLNDIAVAARLEDRPSRYGTEKTDAATMNKYYEDSTYLRNTCSPRSSGVTDSGAVYIFLGVSDSDEMVRSQPAHIIHHTETSDQIVSLAGGMDVDNDGYDDVVYGSNLWDVSGAGNSGGFALLRGRATPDGLLGGDKISPICSPTRTYRSGRADDQLGWSIAMLGDLNGDGCAEYAVGARQSDSGASNQGHVRVIMSKKGSGETCPVSDAELLVFAPMAANARAGTVAGGYDVSGDGIEDLAVGGSTYSLNGNSVGAAWLVPSEYILTLTPITLSTTQTIAADQINSFTPPGLLEPFWVTGETPGDEFGYSVALVPGLGITPDTAAMAVGARFSDLAGEQDSGAAFVYRFEREASFDDSYFERTPYAVFTGETRQARSMLGESLAASLVGGVPTVIVGGSRAFSVGLEQGAAFVLSFAPPR